jgi:hypothetical protein
MRTICAVGLIVTIAGGLSAQVPDSVARPTHSAETLARFETQIFDALFKKIRLSVAQDSAGHAAIRESLVKRDMIHATGESYMQEARAIVQARDVRIRALLQTDEDRATFDANAKVPIYMIDR